MFLRAANMVALDIYFDTAILLIPEMVQDIGSADFLFFKHFSLKGKTMKRSALLITSAMLVLTASPAFASSVPASNSNDESTQVQMASKLASVLTNANAPTIEAADAGLAASTKAFLGQSTLSIEELTVRATTDTGFVQNLMMLATKHSPAINQLFDNVIEDFVETGQSDTANLIQALVSGDPETLAEIMATTVTSNVVSIHGKTWQPGVATKAA